MFGLSDSDVGSGFCLLGFEVGSCVNHRLVFIIALLPDDDVGADWWALAGGPSSAPKLP